jgi:hypothetical protein
MLCVYSTHRSLQPYHSCHIGGWGHYMRACPIHLSTHPSLIIIPLFSLILLHLLNVLIDREWSDAIGVSTSSKVVISSSRPLPCLDGWRAIRLMVFAADKPVDVVLLWEKNIVPWLISRANKFKRTGRGSSDLVTFFIGHEAWRWLKDLDG